MRRDALWPISYFLRVLGAKPSCSSLILAIHRIFADPIVGASGTCFAVVTGLAHLALGPSPLEVITPVFVLDVSLADVGCYTFTLFPKLLRYFVVVVAKAV